MKDFLTPLLDFAIPALNSSVFDVSLFFPVIKLVLLVLAFVVLVKLALKIAVFIYKLKQSYTIFEVKPLRETEQSSYTTGQLFNLIHGLSRQTTFWQRLVGFSKDYAFEIVSTKDDGIRYLIRVHQEDDDLVEKSLLSYLPGLGIKKTKDYLPAFENIKNRVTEFKLLNHFAFPSIVTLPKLPSPSNQTVLEV
jgi:hypothetical protein